MKHMSEILYNFKKLNLTYELMKHMKEILYNFTR